MSNLTDFFPSGGGGGLTPKFEEFNASGTFTPSQALIDAGGYIEVFLVGGGGRQSTNSYGANGGSVIIKNMYLNSTNNCSVTVGSGATSAGSGSSSSFIGSSAGGNDLTAVGGRGDSLQVNSFGASWGGRESLGVSSGSGVLGYGAGGAATGIGGSSGVWTAAANSGQGGTRDTNGGSGYCLIKWYE